MMNQLRENGTYFGLLAAIGAGYGGLGYRTWIAAIIGAVVLPAAVYALFWLIMRSTKKGITPTEC